MDIGLVEDVPAYGRGAGTRWSLRSLLTLTILWFYIFWGKKIHKNLQQGKISDTSLKTPESIKIYY